MFRIFTDGACAQGSRGTGGWAAIIISGNDKTPLSGWERETTSQRMELLAALRGLEYLPQGAEASIYSDSTYLIDVANGDKKPRGANPDLWRGLKETAGSRKVTWVWLPLEQRPPEMEEAHELAHRTAKLAKKKVETPAQMVDISPKPVTEREATARAVVRMKPSTLELVQRGEMAKGDVLALAQAAGIMAAKQTPYLIPLCHPLLLSHIELSLCPDPATSSLEITARVKGEGKTGMEMEALTAAAIAALTVYDMCKAVDPAMSIELRLVRKSGGKSGVVELENP